MTAILVLWVCAGDTACQPVVSSERFTMHECMILGQQRAAQWIGEHPVYTIASYRCIAPERLQRELGRDET